MANSFASINKCLGEYYAAMGNNTYYDDENKLGKFLWYCTENGLEETDLKEELEDNDAEDCMYLEFDHDQFGSNRFPFRGQIEDEEKQLEEMHKIFQYIYHNGLPPKCMKEIIDFKLEVTKKDIEKATKLYQSQVYSVLGAVGLKDGALMEFFTIGLRNNDLTFLNSVVDSFCRDYIAASNKDNNKGSKNLHINDWVKDNKFLRKLHGKNEQKEAKFTSAINSYIHRIIPRLQIQQIYKIKDDIEQISSYIVIGSRFIQNLINEQKVNAPFMIDIIIAVKDAKEDIDGSDLPDLGVDTDDDDEDEDEDEDDDEDGDEVKENANNIDKIGDIEGKLKNEKCRFVKIDIDPLKLSDTAPMIRDLVTSYNSFRSEIKAKDSYPRKRRFNIMIDRRNRDKMDKTDKLFMFEPPSNCNQIPDDPHVPEWYFSASRQCLIPCNGYNAGKGDEKSTISSISKMNGQLMTLSFHIEASDEIKCYLYFEGQTSRFYGQDIIEVFPKLFEMNEKNQQFVKDKKAKEMAKNIQIHDLRFETFYHSFGNDKKFPKYT